MISKGTAIHPDVSVADVVRETIADIMGNVQGDEISSKRKLSTSSVLSMGEDEQQGVDKKTGREETERTGEAGEDNSVKEDESRVIAKAVSDTVDEIRTKISGLYPSSESSSGTSSVLSTEEDVQTDGNRDHRVSNAVKEVLTEEIRKKMAHQKPAASSVLGTESVVLEGDGGVIAERGAGDMWKEHEGEETVDEDEDDDENEDMSRKRRGLGIGLFLGWVCFWDGLFVFRTDV